MSEIKYCVGLVRNGAILTTAKTWNTYQEAEEEIRRIEKFVFTGGTLRVVVQTPPTIKPTAHSTEALVFQS